MIYLVRYSGPFGFLKPWTAVRDIETFSQQFLTPSVIEGIEKKLFPELLWQNEYDRRIIRHRLTYAGISRQQEQTQPRGIKQKPERVTKKTTSVQLSRPRSILTRGALIEPVLYLGFTDESNAYGASLQHVCLCRNEDVLLPDSEIIEIEEADFDKPDNFMTLNDGRQIVFNGFELLFERKEDSFLVGFNRFKNNEPMYGRLLIVGDNPLTSQRL
ncbi:hypothetical protein MJD09_01820 [bacterium]|nr:hypothetical protein [bacterium]